jgi:hypothetical protein
MNFYSRNAASRLREEFLSVIRPWTQALQSRAVARLQFVMVGAKGARRNLALAAFLLLAGFLVACSSGSNDDGRKREASTSAGASIDSAHSFVAAFYSWYVPVALDSSNQERAWYRVLDERASVLSSTLLEALQADRELQRTATGEIAGLEGDPFLNSQDPCPAYAAGNARLVDSRAVVVIEPRCGGNHPAQQPFTAVLVRSGDAWVIQDFEYPGQFGGTLSARLRH